MKLVTIPNYEQYKTDLIFDAYKWDPQFLDSNTVSKYALILTKAEHKLIKQLTEQLDDETIKAENFLNNNLNLVKPLKLSKKFNKELKSMSNYDSTKHIRLMRYDFHPTKDFYAVSEVNSDVPGGFAEGSLMPKFANNLLKNKYDYIDFSEYLLKSIKNKIKKNSNIALVHCTSYSDDRQVMQFLGDKLNKDGYSSIYCDASHIRFKNNKAYSILNNNEVDINCIIRFTPLEWLKDIKQKHWSGYFNTTTPSCNHPISIFAQTKRFPLIFDELEKNNILMTTWKKLLPETLEIKNNTLENDYIYKPVYGRVGEKIAIKEAISKEEYESILKDVKKHPKKYLMQKKFISHPLKIDNQEFHLCLGSYTVNNKHAGYYARISNTPRIDSNALDIPVLIERN